jgi:hypothetical protein
MCWGAVYAGDVAGIEARIQAGSKYLLGFNEPNFKSQANLTPAQAASMWPNLEKIAADKGLELAWEVHRFLDVRRWMTSPDAYVKATGVQYDKAAGTYSTFVNETRNWHDLAYYIPISYAET